MIRHLLFGAALLATLSMVPVHGHEGTRKVLDAFDRIQIRQFKIEVASTGLSANFIIKGHGHFPNGTKLSLAVRYVQGETSELFPYGKPDPKREQQPLFWKDVWVRDWDFSLKLRIRKFRLPPGEYVVAAYFQYEQQSRAVKRQFLAEYVPADERPVDPEKNALDDSRLCADCKRHFELGKTSMIDPSIKLTDKYRNMNGPLWKKQKAQVMGGVFGVYLDWLQQIQDARAALADLQAEILGLGPVQEAHIGRAVEAQKLDHERFEVEAAETLRQVREGLARCKASLAGREGVPQDDVYRYFRLLARGDGMTAAEDRGNPDPQQKGYVPWRFNYVVPRIEVVLAEMKRYKHDNKVLSHRATFYTVMSAADEVLKMVKGVDHLIDGARDLVGPRGVLAEYEKEGGKRSGEMVKKLVDAFRLRFQNAQMDINRGQAQYAKYLERVLKDAGSYIKFPVQSWPVPPSIGEPPQLSKEDKKRAEDREFGDLQDEIKGARKGKKHDDHDDD